MARMYSRKKGQSGSTKPIHLKKPSWMNYSPKEVEQLVIKLAKSGMNSSMIGIQLRDVYGIPDVPILTGKKITKILIENHSAGELPDDLIALMKREVQILKHNQSNHHDMVGKRGQQLTESKIQKLANYYKRRGKLPADWKFDLEKAKLLVG